MTKNSKIALLLLRLALGWLFLYAGFTKLINPNWSAAGYLNNAKTFASFYQWLASPNILPLTNFLNEWGLTLIGIALILGMLVRLNSVLGALMMVLYYFPVLEFPYLEHAYLVDEHIIYALAFLLLAVLKAGRYWGIDEKIMNLPVMQKCQNWLG